MSGRSKFVLIIGVFLAAFYLPLENPRVRSSILEAFYMLQDYARLHVLTCLVPAFFIAGAVVVFVSSQAVMRYLGPQAKRWLAYGVASVSGSILAVCSCTVLPLFSGIYKRGAGLGPASAFLYSGPAINILAMILTARILGWQLGLARAGGAILFSIVIGLSMATIFRREEAERSKGFDLGQMQAGRRSLGQTGFYFATLVLILVFAAWARPKETAGVWFSVFQVKWVIVGALLLFLAYMLKRWFERRELSEWTGATWDFALQILPLLFGGVLVAGVLMGRPGTDAGLIPDALVTQAVGGNSLLSNLVASVAGAFMYFATLTEVPILQGLLGSGMGQGPALALLLAGPALSLPNMLVINSVLGPKKTVTYVSLVVLMATVSGWLFGLWVG
ncbi:MAG: permease [Bacillota bacterium]|nr:permease [Bacillota bacterium]